jgi:hypothetical protein
MIRIVTGLAAALLMSGCATHYQSSGLTGGHSEAKGPGKLEMVRFAANGYTSAALTQNYALYRCAEVAQAHNKPFFMMYDSLLSAARELPGSMPRVGLVQNKPTATAFILLLDAPRPGVHDTRATLDDLRNVVATGKLDQL